MFEDYKTVEQQIDILRSNGLLIMDDTKAKNFLYNNNYYRVYDYSLTLRKNDRFYNNVTFSNIVDIYNFDAEFRNIILKYAVIIETRLKSIYSYEFCKIYEPTQYLKSSIFADEKKYDKIMEDANKIKYKNKKYEPYLAYYAKLNKDIPIWHFVNLLTMGNMSCLYGISQDQLKKSVACAFGFGKNNGSELVEKHIKNMTIIRNFCAHGTRIYNMLFEQKPWLCKTDKKLLIKEPNGEVDNAHFYGFLLVMRQLLSCEKFNEMKNQIIELTNKYPFVRMDYYGFREDWKEKL